MNDAWHYNLSRPDVVLLAATSRLRAGTGLGEVEISHWRAAGLLKPSVVKPVFATLEQQGVGWVEPVAKPTVPASTMGFASLSPSYLATSLARHISHASNQFW
jgi:hypothetical protein